MRKQIKDIVIYNGEKYYTDREILTPYLKWRKIQLYVNHPALMRGYIARWKIENNMLYLTDLLINVHPLWYNADKVQDNIKTADYKAYVFRNYERLDYLFPNQSKVWAEWYYGTLDIMKSAPRGMSFTIEHGYIIKEIKIVDKDFYIKRIDRKHTKVYVDIAPVRYKEEELPEDNLPF